MRHTRIVGVAIMALLLMLTGCDDPNAAAPHATKAPAAGGHQPAAPTGAAQPAPVQADPSAHNTQPGELDLHVEWTSENTKTPACEWSHNGPSQPCANMEKPEKEGGLDYIGLWEHTVPGAKTGDTVTIAAQGSIGVKSIDCSVYWKGAYHSGTTNGKRCSIQFKLN